MIVRIAVLTVAFTLGCGGDSVLHTCDIRESGCQRDVFLAVQDVRGNIWDPWLEPPPMRVISEQQYRAEVIAATEQALQQSGVDYLTPALKLLHMIDPNELPSAGTDFMVAKVSAYYESAAQRVTIVDHGSHAASDSDAVKTLAHELVHAAQDRDVGFSRLYQNVASGDNRNALSALLEGEATLYAFLVDAKQLNMAKGSIDWNVLSDWSINERDAAFADPSPYRIATSQLAYPLGASYLLQVYLSGGPLGIRRIYDHPPLSAARFMVGLGAAADRAAPVWRCNIPPVPPGLRLQLADELGAFSLYALATRITASELDAWERAQLWIGDRFYVYADPGAPSALAVIWQVRFQGPDNAAAFRASLSRMPWATGLRTALEGDTLHVIASSFSLEPDYDAWRQCLTP